MTQQFNVSREQLRLLFLYDFKTGLNADESQYKLNSAFGSQTANRSFAYELFKKFEQGEFDVHDQPRIGRPALIDHDQLCLYVEDDPHLTSRELALCFSVTHVAILNNLKDIGKISKLDRWVPQQLSDFDRQRRKQACMILLSKSRRFTWLKNLVTADEKWCMYSNVTRRRSWTDVGEPSSTQPKGRSSSKKADGLCMVGC